MIDNKTEESIIVKIDEIVNKANTGCCDEVDKLQEIAKCNPISSTNLTHVLHATSGYVSIINIAHEATRALDLVTMEISKLANNEDEKYTDLLNKITKAQVDLLSRIRHYTLLLSVSSELICTRLETK